MGGCCSVDAVESESNKIFKEADKDKDKGLSKDELADWIASQANLWAMLGVNLNMSEEKCRQIATDVAFSLAVGKTIRQTKRKRYIKKNRRLTKQEFHEFRANYIVDPKGSQEFFHRTVFATFDKNGNGTLEDKEVDRFLDIFYEADSIFHGDKRLPNDKAQLKRLIHEKLDTNNDGVFSFDELRGLISGSIDLMEGNFNDSNSRQSPKPEAAKDKKA